MAILLDSPTEKLIKIEFSKYEFHHRIQILLQSFQIIFSAYRQRCFRNTRQEDTIGKIYKYSKKENLVKLASSRLIIRIINYGILNDDNSFFRNTNLKINVKTEKHNKVTEYLKTQTLEFKINCKNSKRES